MPEQAPTIVIHGTIFEVGTRYDNQASIVVAVNGESDVELITILVTKEQAQAFGRYLYGPATITVTAQ